MTISLSQIRPDLEAFNFRRLFIEHLGWNRLQATVPPLEVNGSRYRFIPVAQQGAVVLEVQRDDRLSITDEDGEAGQDTPHIRCSIGLFETRKHTP
jgi:hypothetical protein